MSEQSDSPAATVADSTDGTDAGPGPTVGPQRLAPDLQEIAAADDDGTRLLIGTAHVIAGLMVTGLLQHAGGARGLHEALFPDLPPGRDRDRAMFTAGAVTGAAAAWRRSHAWDPGQVAADAAALYEVGWEHMGRLADQAAAVAPAWWASWGGPPDPGGQVAG